MRLTWGQRTDGLDAMLTILLIIIKVKALIIGLISPELGNL